MALCIASLSLLLTSPPAASQPPPALEVMLRAVAARVASFQSAFARIVAVEHYTQVLRDSNRRTRTRVLVSDMFFVEADPEGRAMAVRNVTRVDGRRVSESAELVAEALALPDERRLEQLRSLADASARYNLGSLRRNFNDPTLGLLFVSEPYQQRFRFRDRGTETARSPGLRRIDFEERVRPTIIRDGRNGSSIPASGRVWADVDGRVWRTEVVLDSKDTRATIRVSYQHDDRLETMVPVTMEEDYRYRDQGSNRMLFINGRATYDGYRRFETSGRIVSP